MSSLEIILRLCDLTDVLAEIAKTQQTVIERSKINKEVKEELWQQVKEADRELDVLEYWMRKLRDTDDMGTSGKETAVGD